MALTSSTMLRLGIKAPDFDLKEVVSGRKISLLDFSGKKGILVMFICEHCPYVKHVINDLVRLGKDYISRGIGIVAISSNDAQNYPQDSPENLKKMSVELKFNFPLCYDETQEVAKAYHAACTPEFYLFDEKLELVYRGQMDDSRPNNQIPVTGKDLRAALDAVLSGQPISTDQKPGIGCGIKWKPGLEPHYQAR